MNYTMDVPGAAALAIVESRLLALNDRNVLPEHEILGILTDAALAQSAMPEAQENPGHHAAVAALMNKILAGGNSVRRRQDKAQITNEVAFDKVLRTGG